MSGYWTTEPKHWDVWYKDDVPIGPISQWVDPKKYSEWTGAGARADSVVMANHDRRQFCNDEGAT
jgi:hypothetical protein